MRKLFSPLAPLSLLLLACAAAGAQPAPPQKDYCRRAAARYVHPSPAREHLTVEQESEYEYRGMLMYLATCIEDDEFTRRVRQEVAAYYAARLASSMPDAPDAPQPPSAPCDDSVRKALFERFKENYKGSPKQQLEAYKVAKEYVCRCAEYDEPTLYQTRWMDFYANPHALNPAGPTAAEDAAGEDALRPRCRCEEMRVKLYDYLNERLRGGRFLEERMRLNHDTVEKFLEVCGDTTRPIDRYFNDLVTKYDKAARESEERRQKGEEPAAKGPAKEQ